MLLRRAPEFTTLRQRRWRLQLDIDKRLQEAVDDIRQDSRPQASAREFA